MRRALDLLLAHHEPFPAVVLDRHWNVTERNASAARFFGWLTGSAGPPARPNVVRALFDPDGLRPFVESWEAVAASLLQRVRAEAVGGVLDEATRALLAEVKAFPGVPSDLEHRLDASPPAPLVPVTFAKEGRRLSFFSALTTLGTPRDVTLQELRLEQFFPADEPTERALRSSGPREIGARRRPRSCSGRASWPVRSTSPPRNRSSSATCSAGQPSARAATRALGDPHAPGRRVRR